jgi:ankyrin repeat protein
LYTGPMYQMYNNELRDTDKKKYPTTIFVIASAVAKLTRIQRIPHGMRLYRGFGGDVEFPDSFYQPDGRGCKGMTEFGFLSTTKKKEIAIQYSGAGKDNRIPVIIEIAVGSVDRGANIREFSQYSHQEEFLWVPGSFLEPVGRPSLEVTDGHVVYVIRVRVVCNLKTMTTDELLSSKKNMHLKAFNELIRDVEGILNKLGDEVEDRLRRDVSLHCDTEGSFVGTPICSTSSLIERIVGQCNEVRDAHGEIKPEDYAVGGRFRDLVCDMLDTTAMAQSKLRGWLDDETRRVCHDLCLPLRTCYRERLSYLSRTLPNEGQDRVEKAKALCIERGLISKSVDEMNDLTEQRLVAAAADGRSAQEIMLLLAAGAKVNDSVGAGVTPLFAAAQYGHADTIRTLCEAKADLAIPDNDGRTPVWIAARNGHLDCVTVLIEENADVNSADSEKASASWVAAQRGHEKVLRFLKDKGANIDAADPDGSTPMLVAAHAGHGHCVKCLIEMGANVTQATLGRVTPLMVAAQMGHADCVQIIVQVLPVDVEQRDDTGWTPPHFASYGGHTECIWLLHDAGFDIKARADDGATPAFTAAKEGRIECVKALLQAQADITVPTSEGQSPVWIAAQQGHTECAQVLLDAGADVRAADNEGKSPAWAAAERGHEEMLRLLQERGADLDAADADGSTPVLAAARAGHEACVRYFIALGADLARSNSSRATPLMAAAQGGHAACLQQLIQARGAVDERDRRGETPVYMAAIGGHTKCLGLLIEAQADVNTQFDEDSWTLVYSATHGGHIECIRLLHDVMVDISTGDKQGVSPERAAAAEGHAECAELLRQLAAADAAAGGDRGAPL